MNGKARFYFVVTALVLVTWSGMITGCVATKATAPPKTGMDQLVGREWVLQEVKGKSVPNDVRATIRFAPDGKLTGEGGCNRFFGSYSFDSGKLTFGPLGSTKMMCSPEIMAVEYPYLMTLSGTLDLALDGNTLKLCSGDNENCLVFSAQ